MYLICSGKFAVTICACDKISYVLLSLFYLDPFIELSASALQIISVFLSNGKKPKRNA
jgi:hypothetical protein